MRTASLEYGADIDGGESYRGIFYFNAYGEINDTEFVSWTAYYSNLWGSYFPWWLAIIVVPTIVVIYTSVIFVNDLDLEDVF